MTTSPPRPLKWTQQFDVLPLAATPPLQGDKIILPPSALQQLLAAATVITVHSTGRPHTSTFDPYNPHTFAAETEARQQLYERQQQLPHPLTFRLVNPTNGRVVFAGIREFSAPRDCVGLSPFLRHSLGIDAQDESAVSQDSDDGRKPVVPKLTVHVQELSKGTYVRLRPLESGYDADDWKALLEQYLRGTFTTLTDREILNIPAGRENFRFLIDGLKPSKDGVSLVDTDIEVDIEALNEEQARETLQKLAKKSQRAPGTKDGSSVGGKLSIGSTETGQVLPGEYVDFSLDSWDHQHDIEIEATSMKDDVDIDLFVSPLSPKHRSRPREDSFVFGDFSSLPAKRLKISHTNAELDHATTLWVSVRAYDPQQLDEMPRSIPAAFSLQISMSSSDAATNQQENRSDLDSIAPGEERCSNCQQAVPKQTMFLHQNFCFRNNVTCPKCKDVFQKSSVDWKQHWHCDHDDAHGNAPYSKVKHDKYMHSTTPCPSCDFDGPNVPALAHHQTTTCPAKPILCQFCHLEVPQQGPDDPSPESAEVILSGLTPHELSDGSRTTECHLCDKIVRLRDMSAHLRHHDLERLSRTRPRLCRNVNCGHTLDRVNEKTGDVRPQAMKNDLGVCDTCFGPFYVSMYDPEGKALRRRVERKYLSQLLTGCGRSWCRNEYCKTGRLHLHGPSSASSTSANNTDDVQSSETPQAGASMTSKEAMQLIKPILDSLTPKPAGGTAATATTTPIPLNVCVDETSQRNRMLAEMMAAEASEQKTPHFSNSNDADGAIGKAKTVESGAVMNGYELEWCVAALDVKGGNLDQARQWLKDYAPTRGEARSASTSGR